jgi:TPR repeat protein
MVRAPVGLFFSFEPELLNHRHRLTQCPSSRKIVTRLEGWSLRLFSASLLLSLSFLFAQENDSPVVPCGQEPLDVHALRQKADAGDAEAQYTLGVHYAFGIQRDEQLKKSVYWFRKSAEQGYAEAEYRLSQAYGSGRGVRNDTKAALYWLRKAAHDGAVNAQLWLGMMYEQGRVVKQDKEKALRWYFRAANQGNPDAQFSVGQAYEEGEFIPQDFSGAATWYRKAAEHVPDYGGAGQGRDSLGLLYLDGRGVPQDYVEAYKWFALAGVAFNMDKAAIRMTQDQIAEAQRRATVWTRAHPVPGSNCLSALANSPHPEYRLAH